MLGGMEHGHQMEAMVTFFLHEWEFFSLREVFSGNGFIPALLHPGLDYTDDFQSATICNNFK